MALTKTPIELSSTPSIVDGGNATAITIDSSENVSLANNLAFIAADGVELSAKESFQVTIDSDDNQSSRVFAVRSGASGSYESLISLSEASGAVFNEDGLATLDFRVESDNEANMFVVNGGTDQVIITNSVQDNASPNYKDSLVLHNSVDGGSRILFSNAVASELASIQGGISGVGSGTDDGTLIFRTALNATASEKMRITNSAVIINEDSNDIDFRVESNNLTYAFVVDGEAGKTAVGGNVTGARLSVFEGGNSTIVAYLQNGSSSINNSSASILYLQTTVDSAIQDGYKLVQFADSDTVLGSISTASSSSNVSYNTSSDERLKENIVDMPSQLENILKVQPRQFDWKKHGNTANGFIAQELYETYPEAVTVGLEDETQDPWSVDYGRLTPYMIKAMQEQQEIIESLKARIAALENK